MNVKEYIASGIVESYVLGLATKEEMAEFERMCAAHSEVRLAREAFEEQLEHYAIQNGVKPPAQLQSKIFAELEVASEKLRSNSHTGTDSITMQEAPVATMRWWKYAAAAAIILFVASAALNIYFLDQFKTYKNLYMASRTELATNQRVMQTKLTDYEHSLQILRDTNMAVIPLKGTAVSPESLATIYWDTRSKDVYLFVNNLPVPASGKQYQLWAIVNGQPVDAGMLDWNDSNAVAAMKNITTAQAFAITLENAGGSPTPNTEAMYVLGTL